MEKLPFNIKKITNFAGFSEIIEYNTHENIESTLKMNKKSRTEKPEIYPNRFPVSDKQILWINEFAEYLPQDFTAKSVLDLPVWADSEDCAEIDFSDRKSFHGEIKFDKNGRPLNPIGRTGLRGRGLLGKWGPNHAGDPIVTRKNPETGKFEALLILRDDCQQWAIPGGMHDFGESIFDTISRELNEEAGVNLDFSKAKIIYQGYVDDPRNTDNAWMETTVGHYHLSPAESRVISPKAASDALDFKWIELSDENLENLYASHADMLKNLNLVKE